MEKVLIFTDPLTPKVYGLYTRENVDIYGWPLSLNWKVLFYMYSEFSLTAA